MSEKRIKELETDIKQLKELRIELLSIDNILNEIVDVLVRKKI